MLLAAAAIARSQSIERRRLNESYESSFGAVSWSVPGSCRNATGSTKSSDTSAQLLASPRQAVASRSGPRIAPVYRVMVEKFLIL